MILDIFQQLKQKDETALRAVMNMYGDYLLRSAYLMVKDLQLAEELVQDAFIIAFRKIDQLEEPAKLKSWITTILLNLCRSKMRRKSFRFSFFSMNEDDTQWEDVDEETPESYLIEQVDNQELSQAILQLDFKYREVITFYYFNELSVIEIAELLKKSESTVKSRLMRARQKLKSILEKGADRDGRQNQREAK